MSFRNAEAWKAAIKKYARQNNMSVTDAQQRYILDEFASKVASSQYRDSFVLKGGYIVSTLLGIDTRTTKDIDITFCSTIYNKSEIETIIKAIINTESEGVFDFEIQSINEGQVDDGYNGFTVMLRAVYDKTRLNMKLDISNNTLIYPNAIQFSFESMFTGENIGIMSYCIENIIAEKFETTLDRGESNSRMRDLFDVVMLLDTQKHLIDPKMLGNCIVAVSEERRTIENLYNFNILIDNLKHSLVFRENFAKYKKNMYPNSDLSIDAVFDAFTAIYKNVESLLPPRSQTSLDETILSVGEKAAMLKRTAVSKDIPSHEDR